MERVLAVILPSTRLHGLVPRACWGVCGAKNHLFLILQLGPETDPLEACGGHQGRGRWRVFSWLQVTSLSSCGAWGAGRNRNALCGPAGRCPTCRLAMCFS